MVDERSAKNIKTLHPEVAILAAKLIETAVAQGICVKVISGLRTYEEQNALYAQGRSKPGLIVNKAKNIQTAQAYARKQTNTNYPSSVIGKSKRAWKKACHDAQTEITRQTTSQHGALALSIITEELGLWELQHGPISHNE